MTELKKDIKLTNPIPCGNNKNLTHIRIEIDHDCGGVSWGTGEYHKRGIVTRITPIEIQEFDYNGVKRNIIGTIIDGKKEHMGFFVFCVPCGRKSPKKLEKVANAVLPLSQDIVDKFIEGSYSQCADIIVNATQNIK